MTKERLIKKYANRRLYDASISKHVTLEDIRDLIVKGEKIRVFRYKNKTRSRKLTGSRARQTTIRITRIEA